MTKKVALNCPEAYHIEHLYKQGYGCKLIAQMIERDETWIDRSLRAAPGTQRLAKFVGRLSNGKRPASQLKRSWKKC